MAILDDCHVLANQPERRERLTALLRNFPKGGHVVMLSRAPNYREIREILNISENTLKTHIRKLFSKLGVSNRTEVRAVVDRLHLL